jgi:hypothetical protein
MKDYDLVRYGKLEENCSMEDSIIRKEMIFLI